MGAGGSRKPWPRSGVARKIGLKWTKAKTPTDAIRDTRHLSDAVSDTANQGIVTDISFGGSSIESGEVPTFGTKVTIRARLPGQTADMTLPGAVRWVKPTGFGVQFGLLGVRETHALAQFLRTRG